MSTGAPVDEVPTGNVGGAEVPPESSKKQGTTMGRIREMFSRIGAGIDAGVSTLYKDIGQNIRVSCPSCHGELSSPPNEFVECPKCQHQFQSATTGERMSGIMSDIKQETKGAYQSARQSPQPDQPEGSSGHNPTGTRGA